MTRTLRITVAAALLVGAGLLLRIPTSPAGEPAAEPLSPGQAALALECPDGDRQVIGEAVYPETAPQSELEPREALRQFLRRHFRGLLKLRFLVAARQAGKLQLVAEPDGRRVASVLLTRGPDGARAEGLSACESAAGGR